MNKPGSASLSFVLIAFVVAIMVILYFLADTESAQTLLLSLLLIVVVFSSIILFWQHGHKVNKLRKKLLELEQLLGKESVESIKERYIAIYNLYLKLSETQKQNFYGRITTIREKLEEQLKAETKMGELLQRAESSMTERRKNYNFMYENFQKLPQKVQQQYYPQVIALKQQLEKGKV